MLFPGKQTEGLIFRLGCSSFIVQVILLIILWMINPALAAQIVAIITASLMGGRMASVLTGLEFGISSVALILLLAIFNASWVLVFYPLIVTFSHHMMVKIKSVNKIINATKKTAEKQKERITQYGTWGLAFFVWLPFPWTGALIGSVVGFLIGLSTKRTILIVMPCMLLGIASCVFGFKYLFLVTGSTGKIITLLVVGGIIFSSLFFRLRDVE